MVVVLMLYRKRESARPTVRSVSLDKMRAADTEIRGQVMGVLAFDSLEQFETWKRNGGLDRFPGCGYRLFNRAEDMRNSNFAVAGFKPKCRHCKWYEEISSTSNVGRCQSALAGCGLIEPHAQACKYFKEG